MNYYKDKDGIISLKKESSYEVVEKILYSVWDNELGEYTLELEEIIELQKDVFETMKDRAESHDDELGQDYSHIVNNYEPKDLSFKFVLDFYRDLEYLVEKHTVLDLA